MTRISKQSLSDQVYRHLVSQLVRRQLKVGSRLNVREIADELSVSRTTINKALNRLVKSGWVRTNESRRPLVIAYPPKKEAPGESTFDFTNQTDSSYEVILERILRGDYQPGEIVKERPLAKELGVNPATVRRAAEWLRNDGLLVRLPRRGWRVAMLDARDIKDVYQIRLLLEPLAIRGSLHRISDEKLEELEAETERLIEVGEKATVYDRRQADHNFHQSLCEASGNRILAEALEPLIRKVLLITTVGFRYGRASRSFEEHKQILKALRQRDENLAIKHLKQHLATAQKFNTEIWERR
ncbi:MAG: GntR family transcriptional regulator [Planctomycetes bacterium]|nr:GntR family transcriptional regulator [Planctomycetota bacterium]